MSYSSLNQASHLRVESALAENKSTLALRFPHEYRIQINELPSGVSTKSMNIEPLI